MRRIVRLDGIVLLSVAVGFTVGCAAETEVSPGATARITDGALVVSTGHFVVPPASESFTCFYTDFVTDRELAIAEATGTQAEGGHHITVYYTAAVGPQESHPCTDAEMASWSQIGGTGGEPGAGDDQSLPEGLAIRVPAGVQLVLQAHYINTHAEPLEVVDEVSARILQPSEIRDYASMFVVHEDSFEVAARRGLEVISECELTMDLNVVLLMGHMHAAGTEFALEVLEPGATEPSFTYDHSWQSAFVSHPPVVRWTMDDPLVLRAGTRLRQTCRWQNPSTEPLLFPTEMCDGVLFTFPEAGDSMVVCNPMIRETREL